MLKQHSSQPSIKGFFQPNKAVACDKPKSKQKQRGQVRVGRCEFVNGKRIDPTYPGFTPIVIMTPKSQYGALSPYTITDAQGQIIQNVWQKKLYAYVPAIDIPLGKWSTLRWKHPREVHVDTTGIELQIGSDGKPIHIDPNTGRLIGQITQAYIDWSEKLGAYAEAVRYPVGFDHRTTCIGHIIESEEEPLCAGSHPKIMPYIQARKQKYGPLYMDGLEKSPLAHQLRKRLENGENLLIIEVDVAPSRSLQYYIDTYMVDQNFFERNTMLASLENLKIMLEDGKEQCGHGHFAAMWFQKFTIRDVEQARSLKRHKRKREEI